MSSDDRRESMQEHTREFASRVSHDIDHSISQRTLGTDPGSLKESTLFGADLPSGQISLAQQFANPRAMRDAIILREIFERPEQRWQFDEPMWGEVGDL